MGQATGAAATIAFVTDSQNPDSQNPDSKNPDPDRFYFRQLLAGRDFAVGNELAVGMANFAYLIGDRGTGECMVIDPAYGVAELNAVAQADGMRLTGALITHYHADHCGGEIMGIQIGSMETLRTVLGKIKTDEVAVNVRHSEVGGINESDVSLAEATGSIILGFNVTSSSKARALAERKNVEIRLYEVIYELVDDVTQAASGLLTPEIKLEVLGHAEVREVFKISKVGMIAGCYVTDGVVERNAQIRVTRDGIVVEKDRRLEQLKRLKDDAKEVRAGMECGMKIVGYNDIKVGDVLECYRTSSVTRSMPATR